MAHEHQHQGFVYSICGGGEIRTHGTLASTTVFETVPFNHSGTPPEGVQIYTTNDAKEPTHKNGIRNESCFNRKGMIEGCAIVSRIVKLFHG